MSPEDGAAARIPTLRRRANESFKRHVVTQQIDFSPEKTERNLNLPGCGRRGINNTSGRQRRTLGVVEGIVGQRRFEISPIG